MVQAKTRLALVGISLVMLLSACGSSPEMIAFAKCMSEKGAVMYGSYTCIHCLNQKEKFGSAFSEIKYVECNPNSPKADVTKCETEKIRVTPTWTFGDGSRNEGEMKLVDLGAKTNCEVPLEAK